MSAIFKRASSAKYEEDAAREFAVSRAGNEACGAQVLGLRALYCFSVKMA
jgi:hypothetical protein